MPFGCFKKEKSAKTKTKGKKGHDEVVESQKGELEEVKEVSPQLANDGTDEVDLRSPRGDRTPKTPKFEESVSKAQEKEEVEASESSVLSGDASSVSSKKKSKTPRSRANTGPKSPRGKSASSPVSDLPLKKILEANPTSTTQDDEEVRPASVRIAPTVHGPDSTPATPHFFSPRMISRRGSAFSRVSMSSRGRSSSISMNDWSKIQTQTNQSMALERKRMFERKQTLASNMEASLTALKKQEEDAKRQSTELDLDDLDGLELEDDEVALAKFKEEDFDEEALEEKIFEQHIVAHLEQDVQETKRALAAMNDNDSSMDLDDLNDLDDALDLDDSQDLDGLDIMDSLSPGGAIPTFSIPLETKTSTSSESDDESSIPPSNTFDEPSITEETHTERQGSDVDLSTSNGITPRRHKVQNSADSPLPSLTVDPVA